MPVYPIEIPDNIIKHTSDFDEGVDLELDIHNTNATNIGDLTLKTKNGEVTVTKKSERYDRAEQTFVTTYSIKATHPGLPVFNLEDEITITRTGYKESKIGLKLTLQPKDGYPKEIPDKTIRRQGNKEQIKFSLWLGRKNKLSDIDVKVASGAKYVLEKTRGNVIVASGNEYRRHDFELNDQLHKAVIQDQLLITENGKESDTINLHLVLLEETQEHEYDLSFTSKPVGANIPILDENDQPGRGEVSIPVTPGFNFDNVNKISFCCVYDSSDASAYDDNNDLVEIKYQRVFDGDESKLQKFTDDKIGKDHYIGKYIGPDDNKTFSIIIIPQVVGMKCLKIVVEASDRKYKPLYYWYEVNAQLMPEETVPEADRSEFQPQIVAYDGLMAETRLHPSLPIRKTEAVKSDVIEINKGDVDSKGRLILLEVNDVITTIKQELGSGGGGSGNPADKPDIKPLPSDKVDDWKNVGSAVIQEKPKTP